MPPNLRNSRLLKPSAYRAASRRRFLQVSAAAVSGVVLSNCARNLSNNTTSEASPTASPGDTGSTSGGDKTLHIYTWANYTDDELLKGFEAKTGIRPIIDTFDSNESMLAKMQAGGGKAYSVIYPSDYMVEQMVKSGMLVTLDKSKLQQANWMEQWQNPSYDPENAHSIPTVWGTTGLIFDPDKVDGEIKGWDYIWDNVDRLGRRVTLLNDVREVMGATLQFLGYSMNSTKPAEIEEAYNRLLEIKPTIASFMTNGWEDQLASGDLEVSMAYSQDALFLKLESPNLEYVVPETGSSLWTDTMVIPKSAPNTEAAYEWLNYILEPANSASLVERLKVATPNEAAFDKLPKALQENRNLFPPKAVLAKCERVAPVPQNITDLYDRFWTQLTSS
jgi:spermidine/putrescine transport system substrate-binding protein